MTKEQVQATITVQEIDWAIEFHRRGQAAAFYRGWMNRKHAQSIRDLMKMRDLLVNG